ncbi:MAG: outer membrane lipid asymmetry maintenance protein MlaD [Primorskyibacter sp.]
MAHQTTEVIVGAVVVAVAVTFGLYTAQISGLGGGGASYELRASFRSIEGVGPGTEIRLAGVKVGSVADVALNPQTYRAETTLNIHTGIEVPDDSAVVIASEGLLGGNFVEISPGGSPFTYAAGDEILDTQGSVSLLSLLLRYVGGGSE